jgi:formylglycine-generating enzyme required for sulfatase activity
MRSRHAVLAPHARPAALRVLPAVLLTLAVAPDARAQSCIGDLNGDGVIDGSDLGALLAAWGPCESCGADLNTNGVVDGIDLGIQLGNWGECFTVPAWATLVERFPDPAVVTDPAMRAAIIATGRPWRVRDTATQVEMLLVPPGTFQMGCITGSNQYGCFGQELPVHHVTLTNAFYLGRYEVTQSQWVARMGSNPSYHQGVSDSATRPVEQVSWNTIQGHLSATGFRLPTEAEWEYACRAGTQTPFSNGSTNDSTLGALAWYGSCCGGNSGGESHAVGGKQANALGFHDMLGNVWEWVSDRFGSYTADAQTNPTGPASGSDRVMRGGSYFYNSNLTRSSYRNLTGVSPDYTINSLGFRVARNP